MAELSAALHFMPQLPPRISPESSAQIPVKSTRPGSWGQKICIYPLYSRGAHKAGPLCVCARQTASPDFTSKSIKRIEYTDLELALPAF